MFFSFFTAPAVFTVLPRPEAGQLISTIFPRYYMLGYIVGTISLVLAIYFTAVRGAADMVGRHDGRAGNRARNHLLCGHRHPAARRRDPHGQRRVRIPTPSNKAEFDKLHHKSVILNGAVLLLNLAAIVGTAGALTPRG